MSRASGEKVRAGLAVALGGLAQEVLGQVRQVGEPLAKRRQVELHHAEAEGEVVAERALAHHGLEVAVRRGDHAHVDLDRVVGPDADHLAGLERAQQVGLRREGHVADLVQEERAAGRRLEAALAAGGRAGEGPLLVAEELALEHALRERGAVERDERSAPPRPGPVKRLGDELLARAALATDENRRVRLDDLVHHVEDALHRMRAPEDLRKGERLVEVRLELAVLELERDAGGGRPDGLPQDADVEGASAGSGAPRRASPPRPPRPCRTP